MIRLSAFSGVLLAVLGSCNETTNQTTQKPVTAPPAAAPSASTVPRIILQTAAYAGEYNWGDTTREQAGGTLLVYPESDTTVLVSLDISNGPPAFNLGQLYQRAVVRGGLGQCFFKEQYDSLGCRLRLAFSPEKVVIETEQGYDECGFGHGVSADETYRRTSSAVPQQFINAEGTKISFKTTTPEQYNSPSL